MPCSVVFGRAARGAGLGLGLGGFCALSFSVGASGRETRGAIGGLATGLAGGLATGGCSDGCGSFTLGSAGLRAAGAGLVEGLAAGFGAGGFAPVDGSFLPLAFPGVGGGGGTLREGFLSFTLMTREKRALHHTRNRAVLRINRYKTFQAWISISAANDTSASIGRKRDSRPVGPERARSDTLGSGAVRRRRLRPTRKLRSSIPTSIWFAA